MSHALTSDETALIETARTFASDVVAPNAAQWEFERRLPREALTAACEAGLGGLLVPKELGGQGAGFGVTARIVEVLAAADFGFTFPLIVHNNLAGNIARNGSDDQKARYLPDMIAGRRIGAFLLTEPGAGSDAASITTTASRANGSWRIEGEKAWVTSGVTADILSVYAQTDAAAGWRGIACFLVEADTPGVVRGEPYALIGGHAVGASAISFKDCVVGDDAHFIAAGSAFKAAMAGIDIARANVAMACCGMLSVALETALEYMARRRAFDQPTSEFQGLQWELADVATDLEAARLLARQAVAKFDAGADSVIAAAHAKKFATRVAFKGIHACMQAMGAVGARADYPLARHLAAVKLAEYMDGTTGIQNVVIARSLFGARSAPDSKAAE
ncbi:MAG: acyl-CoA dehydrogenase family protein [Alphaproteobacteria bacterium]|nr:acyl-CoA dehydrogenase family protein [Alphaproteobacteria bacterium]